MKNKFFGKYYKFVANNNSFAVIDAISNEGKSIQLITKEASYQINDLKQVKINNNEIIFDVSQDNLKFKGILILGKLNPLKHKVMGPFTYIPFMECKHQIYSMFHIINGHLEYNGQQLNFDNGIGYIEGDSGSNFPNKYIWYNSILPNRTITIAIASIPFGLFSFTGILCFIKTKDKEYYFCTWNNVKVRKIDKFHLELTKGKYTLSIDISDNSGYELKAPVKGQMNRYIKENVAVESRYKLTYKNNIIFDEVDKLSSCEWMWN